MESEFKKQNRLTKKKTNTHFMNIICSDDQTSLKKEDRNTVKNHWINKKKRAAKCNSTVFVYVCFVSDARAAFHNLSIKIFVSHTIAKHSWAVMLETALTAPAAEFNHNHFLYHFCTIITFCQHTNVCMW